MCANNSLPVPKNVVLTLRDDHVNGVEVVKVDEPVLSLGPVLIGDPTLIDGYDQAKNLKIY